MTSASRLRRHGWAAPLGVALVAAALISGGCGTGGVDKSTDASGGKQLFVQKCGSCHTLADAGTTGKVGPDLDAAFVASRQQGFRESTIRQIVRDQIHYPSPAAGSKDFPVMPPDLVKGSDAAAVAAYVASVAGTGAAPSPPAPSPPSPAPPPPSPGPPPPPGPSPATAEGKRVFASAGCGNCHTLADAGTTGTIGPNLDDAKPSFQLAVTRVTNGKAPMPSFKGQLSKSQIDAVAKYVSSVAGK